MNNAVFRARGLPIEGDVGNGWRGVSKMAWLVSHHGALRDVEHHFAALTKKLVGASLLAIAPYQSPSMLLTNRNREQGRSHIGRIRVTQCYPIRASASSL